MNPEIELTPTRESIAAALAAAAKERQHIFNTTGVLIHDDGRMVIVSADAKKAS